MLYSAFTGFQFCFEARLSMNSSANAVGNGAAQTTIYLTPYKGDTITLYVGGRWRHYTLSQISASVPASANQTMDIFAYYSSGVALDFLNWTNDTTRVALDLQDGVLVKGGDATRLYVGTLHTYTSGEVTDNTAHRCLYNHYNRILGSLTFNFNAASWTYATSNTTRYANNNSANSFGIVSGLAGSVTMCNGEVHHDGNDNYYLGIGDNSSTTFSSSHQNCTMYNGGAPGIYANLLDSFLGFHTLSINERQSNTTTTNVNTFQNSIARCKIFGITER